jgi:DNA-directed RNA polymerase delta subunit
MANTSLIDKAYEYAYKNYKGSKFTFDDIWNGISSDVKLTKEELNDGVGKLYSEILQDYRFIYTGNKLWALKEFIKQSDLKKYLYSLYDLENSDVTETDFKQQKSTIADMDAADAVSEEELNEEEGE